MGKLKPVRILTDDCTLHALPEPQEAAYKGRADELTAAREAWRASEYHPHEGEWVEAILSLPASEYVEHIELLTAQAQLAADQDDVDKATAVAQQVAAYNRQAARTAAKRLTAWNWTDVAGEPLPQPHNDEAVVLSLNAGEIGYLLAVLRGGAGSESKNA